MRKDIYVTTIALSSGVELTSRVDPELPGWSKTHGRDGWWLILPKTHPLCAEIVRKGSIAPDGLITITVDNGEIIGVTV